MNTKKKIYHALATRKFGTEVAFDMKFDDRGQAVATLVDVLYMETTARQEFIGDHREAIMDFLSSGREYHHEDCILKVTEEIVETSSGDEYEDEVFILFRYVGDLLVKVAVFADIDSAILAIGRALERNLSAGETSLIRDYMSFDEGMIKFHILRRIVNR